MHIPRVFHRVILVFLHGIIKLLILNSLYKTHGSPLPTLMNPDYVRVLLYTFQPRHARHKFPSPGLSSNYRVPEPLIIRSAILSSNFKQDNYAYFV
jgi:hypothetical protein